MMKTKILSLIAIMLLALSVSASAWKDYGGLKEPYPVGVYVLVDGVKLGGISVNACLERTGYCEDMITNKEGYAQFEVQNFKMPDSGVWATAPPFMKGYDKVTVKVCDDKPECSQVVDSSVASVPVILRFNLGSGIVQVPAQPEVVIKEVIKEVPVESYGTDVTVEELSFLQKNYKWFSGILAILTFLVGLGLAGRKKANKTFATILKKFRAGKYKPSIRRP